MRIMPYIMATAFVLAATVVPAAAAELDGRSNGATNTLGWGAIHGVPVEAMNAAEMAAVTGESVFIFVHGTVVVNREGGPRFVIGTKNDKGSRMVIIHF